MEWAHVSVFVQVSQNTDNKTEDRQSRFHQIKLCLHFQLSSSVTLRESGVETGCDCLALYTGQMLSGRQQRQTLGSMEGKLRADKHQERSRYPGSKTMGQMLKSWGRG